MITITKPLILALVAACGVNPNPVIAEPPAEQPDKLPPNEVKPKDNVYFCCQTVDPKTETGEGCLTIGEKQIDQCSTVLACADGFTKVDGVVKCS